MCYMVDVFLLCIWLYYVFHGWFLKLVYHCLLCVKIGFCFRLRLSYAFMVESVCCVMIHIFGFWLISYVIAWLSYVCYWWFMVCFYDCLMCCVVELLCALCLYYVLYNWLPICVKDCLIRFMVDFMLFLAVFVCVLSTIQCIIQPYPSTSNQPYYTIQS